MNPRLDDHGDPLPPFVERRFGTARWRGRGGSIDDLTFSADGSTVYATSAGVDAFDVATGRVRWSCRDRSASRAAVLRHPDGDLLVTVGANGLSGALSMFDAATGARRMTAALPAGLQCTVAVSHDGRTIFAGGFPGAGFLLTPDGAVRAALPPDQGSHLNGACFSPDGATVVTTASGGGVTLWSVADAAPVRRFGREEDDRVGASHALFTPDGRRLLVTTNEGDVVVYEVDTGAELTRWRAHGASISGLAFTADGARLLTAGDDQTLSLWRLADRTRLATRRAVTSALRLSPDETAVAITEGPRVALVDLATFEERFPPVGHAHSVSAVALSRDGETLVSFSQGEPTLGRSTADGSTRFSHPTTAYVTDLRRLPEGDRLAVMPPTPDGMLVLDLAARRLSLSEGNSDEMHGRWWARAASVTSHHKGLSLTNAGGVTHSLKADVNELVLTPDDRYAVFLDGSRLVIWDLDAHAEAVVVKVRSAWGLALSPRGDEVAVRTKTAVQRYGVPDGVLRGEWKGGPQVEAVVYAPDGRHLLASTVQETSVVECASGREVARLDSVPSGAAAIAFDRDGTRLYTGDWDSTVLAWDLPAAIAAYVPASAKKKPTKKG